MPIFNACDTLDVALGHLAAQDYPGAWEVVLVDNRSTDGSAAIARSWLQRLPRARLVDASDRQGVSHARNRGVAEANGDLIAICDADDAATTSWLNEMVNGAMSGDLVAGHNRLMNPLNQGISFLVGESEDVTKPLPKKLGYLPFAGGGNFAAWRDVIEATGGWDESFMKGGDDIDFSWRAQRLGFALVFQPTAVVDYRLRPGLRSMARQRFHFGFQDSRLALKYKDVVGYDHAAPTIPELVRESAKIVTSISLRRTDLALGVRVIAYRIGRVVGERTKLGNIVRGP